MSDSAANTRAPTPARNVLIDGPIPSTLLRFALPVIGANALQSMNGVVNALWVSRILGLNALAATSNANMILFLLLSAAFGVGMACSIYVAQTIGAQNTSELKRVVGTAASFFIGTAILVGVFGFLFAPEILSLMATPPEVHREAVAYLRMIFVATPFMYLFAFIMMVQRGVGDTRTPFLFTIAAVFLDIGLNPLLMRGVGPVPALGIAGSALATVIAQGISLGGMLFYLYRRESPLVLRRGELHHLKPHPATLWRLVSRGIPMSLQMLIMSATGVIMISFVNRYGARTIAAYGAVSQLWSYVQMPALGIGMAVSSMAAQNVGAGRWDRVSKITLTAVVYGIAMTIVPMAALFVFEDPLIGFFLPGDGEALRIAQHINALSLWALVLFSVTFILFGIVRATGAAIPQLIILIFSLWLVRLPFTTLLMPTLGADAIWWSFPLSSAVSLTCAVLYYRFGRWRNVRMAPVAARTPAPAAG